MNTKTIKFTIITVVYNGENCIKKTIDSIISQTYKDYEYIIVDGSSKDRTINICKEYKKHITKVISEPDKGLYDAMNKGIENASGDYIIFMNCDDTFYDEKVLEKVAKGIEENNYPDFIYGDAIEVSEDETQQFLKKARSHKWIWYGMFTHHQAMFYKVDIIKENNLRYDLQYKIAADYAFTANYLKNCKSFLYLDFVFCGFKQGGLSSNNHKLNFKHLIEIKKEIIGLSPLQIWIILSVQKFLVFFRNNFGALYSLLRFKNVK